MRRRRQGKSKEAPDLDITAFLNLMVVLVPFLLVSAVFSRVTILELNMPTGAGGGAPDDPTVTVEVVVRKDVLEISDGEKVVARFPNLIAPEQLAEMNQGDAENTALPVLPTEQIYDLKKLTQFLLQVKASYPDKTDSILLMEPEVAYEHLVGVMDAVRGAEVVPEGSENPEEDTENVILFPDISIGDAP